MVEIALGPLSRAEAAEQVTALAGGPVPPEVVDGLFARAEGNPFFTEQLVAAVPSRQGPAVFQQLVCPSFGCPTYVAGPGLAHHGSEHPRRGGVMCDRQRVFAGRSKSRGRDCCYRRDRHYRFARAGVVGLD